MGISVIPNPSQMATYLEKHDTDICPQTAIAEVESDTHRHTHTTVERAQQPWQGAVRSIVLYAVARRIHYRYALGALTRPCAGQDRLRDGPVRTE